MICQIHPQLQLFYRGLMGSLLKTTNTSEIVKSLIWVLHISQAQVTSCVKRWLGVSLCNRATRCRSAELRGLQSPGVAPAAGAHVLLVAPVVRLHHGVQTQPALHRSCPAHLGCCCACWELCPCSTVSITLTFL